MNNLFKRSAASFALVGALTSSLFGGNAAYIDIRVKYLSGTDSATLGYESWDKSKSKFKAGAKKDLVELYIRVLDEDGNFADKSHDGIALQPIVAKRTGNNNKNLKQPLEIGLSESDVTGMGNLLAGNGLAEANNTITRAVAVEPINNKNAARYTIDYSDYTAVELMDHLTITAGKMDKNVDIKLSTGKANGLLVRITRKSKYDADATLELNNGRYINSYFTNIKLLGEPRIGAGGNLSVASDDVTQLTAGDSIPFRIYASTGNARGYTNGNVYKSNNPHKGRFTVASELDDAEIVVVAVGDYGNDNTAETYLNKITVKMKDGVAFGEIPIMYGLPEKNSSNDATGDISFDDRIPAVTEQTYGGLGVRLVAYVKDNIEISNNDNLRLDGSGKLKTNSISIGDHNSTDSIKIRSDVFAGFKVGEFDTTPSNSVAANLWTKTSTEVFVANSKGITSADSLDKDRVTIKTIVAVDKLGNPTGSSRAILASDGNFTFKVAGISQAGNIANGVDFNISSELAMATGVGIGITSGNITIADGDYNASVDKTVTALYSGGPLSGKDPIVFKAHGLDLVGKTTSDVVGRLSPLIQEVIVTNATATTTKLYTEQKKTKDYTNMEISIKVHEILAEGNVSLHFSVAKVEDGTFNSAIQFASGTTPTTETAAANLKSKLGVYVVDFNTSATGSDTVTVRDAGGVIGTIKFESITSTNYANLVGTTTKLSLKGSTKADGKTDVPIYRRNVDLYVATTTPTANAESFVDKESEPGLLGKTQIDFDFSGEFIEKYSGKTRATITFAGTETGDNIKASVLGASSDGVGTIEGPAPISNIVKNVLIPASGRVSVVLYGGSPYADLSAKNKDANKTTYNIQSITVNSFEPVETSRHKNELTEAIDIDMIEEKNVTVEAGGVSAAHKVAILSIGSATKKTGTGIDADNLGKLTDTNLTLKLSSSSIGIAFSISPDTTSPVFANGRLMTNKYYSLFDSDSNLKVKGKYGEEINMESAKIADNYILSVSDSECAKVEMAGGGKNTDPAYVYFDECAAGKSIDVIISVKGNEEVKNTITFTNIVKAVENTKLIVSLDVGTEKYNVVNNDVVIKIRGDGQTAGFNKAVITVKSDNAEATVKLIPVRDLFGKEFGSNLNSKSQLLDVISAEGNYYVVSSDKEGMITVTATDSIPAAKAKGGVEVLLKGETSFKMTAIDLAAPTATSVAVPSGIITTISDAHLNTEATKVSIWNIQGDKITDVDMGESGVYTAKLSQGSYQVRISAVDLGGNVYNKFFLRTVGEQSGPSIESLLIANGSYKVSGTFVSHDFKSKNPNHDWAYTDTAGTTYQLLGNEPDSESPFGWKKTDAKVSTSSDWFMIKLEGTVGNADAKGRFGWILVNKAGDTYKLKGVKTEDNTFEFSSALHLNAKIDGSNVTFTAK